MLLLPESLINTLNIFIHNKTHSYNYKHKTLIASNDDQRFFMY